MTLRLRDTELTQGNISRCRKELLNIFYILLNLFNCIKNIFIQKRVANLSARDVQAIAIYMPSLGNHRLITGIADKITDHALLSVGDSSKSIGKKFRSCHALRWPWKAGSFLDHWVWKGWRAIWSDENLMTQWWHWHDMMNVGLIIYNLIESLNSSGTTVTSHIEDVVWLTDYY